MKLKGIRKISSRFMTFVFVFVLITMSAFSASAAGPTHGDKKVTSSGKMGLVLEKGKSGDSSEVTFQVSGLPSNAVITRLEVNPGRLGGQGAVITNYLNIRSSEDINQQIKWGGAADAVLEADNFVGRKANGTYTIYFNATCIGGAMVNGNILDIGTKSYQSPSIVVYWKIP